MTHRHREALAKLLLASREILKYASIDLKDSWYNPSPPFWKQNVIERMEEIKRTCDFIIQELKK